jgi:hypothetical protein
MQSGSAAQLVLQAVAPHTYGVHCVVAAEGQVPVPLQEPAGTAVPAAQLAARHWVEAPGYPQAEALLPSQEPPQAEPSVAQAGRIPCGAPAVTVVQAPTLPGTSQASHWPAQAAVQQTPSAQTPPAHSPAPPQAVP